MRLGLLSLSSRTGQEIGPKPASWATSLQVVPFNLTRCSGRMAVDRHQSPANRRERGERKTTLDAQSISFNYVHNCTYTRAPFGMSVCARRLIHDNSCHMHKYVYIYMFCHFDAASVSTFTCWQPVLFVKCLTRDGSGWFCLKDDRPFRQNGCQSRHCWNRNLGRTQAGRWRKEHLYNGFFRVIRGSKLDNVEAVKTNSTEKNLTDTNSWPFLDPIRESCPCKPHAHLMTVRQKWQNLLWFKKPYERYSVDHGALVHCKPCQAFGLGFRMLKAQDLDIIVQDCTLQGNGTCYFGVWWCWLIEWLDDWWIKDALLRVSTTWPHLTTFVFPLAGSMLCHLWEVPSITIIRSLDCARSCWLWHADCLQSQTWAEVHPKPGSQSSPRPGGAEQYVLNEHCEIPTAPAWDQTWRRQGLAIFKDYTCRWRPSQSCSVRRDA